ncbi:hypothetical protein ABZ738_05350 [Micromonospora sp. NPDC047793]|uniref:hypothetical protein n=1 Tax=Micromonospora sp. NPDC047793 TaxID=3154342 RepID=UPI0033FA6F3F
MCRLGAAAAAFTTVLLVLILGIYSQHIDHVTPELIVLCLATGLLGALGLHLHRLAQAADARETARPREIGRGENVIPIRAGLDPETAAAVRRINRRLVNG